MFMKMPNHKVSAYTIPNVSSLLSSSCLCAEYKDPKGELVNEMSDDFDENVCDFDDLEEAFSDHLLMGKRLRKTLYAGSFEDLEDLPDHPPLALTGLALELFSKAVPNYGLDILDMDYVAATSEATRVPPCAMIIAMIYLERLQLQNSEYLETVSPPGLFVVTMLVASKFLFEDEEDIVTNQMWAEALNLDIKELNDLEREFLSAINWKVFVDHSYYMTYLSSVEKRIAMRQSTLRNWLSYSDLSVITHDPNFENAWKDFLTKILKTTLVCTLSYAATALAVYCATVSVNKFVPRTVVTIDSYPSSNLEAKSHFQMPDERLIDAGEPSNIETTFVDFKYNSLITEMSGNMQPKVKNINSDFTFAFTKKAPFNYFETDAHKLDIFFSIRDIFSGNKSLLNNAYNSTNDMYWPKLKQKKCISVLIR